MKTKKLNITVLGKTYEVLVEDMGEVSESASLPAERVPQAAVTPIDTPVLTSVTSPMSGTILNVFVHVGDEVQAGDKLCLLEAMKIQNVIPSPTDGTVRQILTAKGDAVDTGTVLFTIEPQA